MTRLAEVSFLVSSFFSSTVSIFSEETSSAFSLFLSSFSEVSETVFLAVVDFVFFFFAGVFSSLGSLARPSLIAFRLTRSA